MSSADAKQKVRGWIAEKKWAEAERGVAELKKAFGDEPEVAELEKSLLEAKEGRAMGAVHGASNAISEGLTDALSSAKGMAGAIGAETPTPDGEAPPTQNEKILGALCYLYFFVLIPLLLKRESAYVQYHAWQGLTLTTMVFVIQTLFLAVLNAISPVFGFLFGIPMLAIYIWAGYSAYAGRRLALPAIAPLAEKVRALFT